MFLKQEKSKEGSLLMGARSKMQVGGHIWGQNNSPSNYFLLFYTVLYSLAVCCFRREICDLPSKCLMISDKMSHDKLFLNTIIGLMDIKINLFPQLCRFEPITQEYVIFVLPRVRLGNP